MKDTSSINKRDRQKVRFFFSLPCGAFECDEITSARGETQRHVQGGNVQKAGKTQCSCLSLSPGIQLLSHPRSKSRLGQLIKGVYSAYVGFFTKKYFITYWNLAWSCLSLSWSHILWTFSLDSGGTGVSMPASMCAPLLFFFCFCHHVDKQRVIKIHP